MNDLQIPREVRDLMGETNIKPATLRLDALAVVLGTKRDDAVTARRSSGIELVWMDCEEAYLGIDDENRSEFLGARWAKPTTMSGPVTTNNGRRPNSSNSVRSTAFVRMTSRFVNAGAAKLCEITLPIDDKAFSYEATPVPTLIDEIENDEQVLHPETGEPLTRPPTPDERKAEMNPMGKYEGPEELPLTKGDLAQEKLDAANAAAKRSETRVYDWMVESQYAGEMRKVVFDAARIGVGVLKGPHPVIRFDTAWREGKLVIIERVAPAYTWVDPWNFYPEGSCGEDIQKSTHLFEVDYLSPKSVEELRNNPAYLPGRIARVLEMGPAKRKALHDDKPGEKERMTEDGRFEAWYFVGTLSKDDIEACIEEGADADMFGDRNRDTFDVIATMINDIVVRVTPRPLQSKNYNYHVMPWGRRSGHWAGVGVAEEIRMPQRMVNGATRAMLVNAAKSAGGQIVLDRSCVTPADRTWDIYPDKLWFKNADATVDDVRKAFTVFEFPNVQKEMMAIIEYAWKLAEETSSIPMLTQGQSGKTTPETLGGQQLQDNNANQLLRAIGHQLDDCITEPVARQSYEWLLLDPDVPDEDKLDINIDAHGSSAMVERYIQNQAIQNLGGIVINPAFGLDPKMWANELLKSQKLDPRNFKYSKEDLAKIEQAPPPPPPQVQVAQINAEVTKERIRVDTDRDTAYNQSLANRDQIAASAKMEELKIKRELAMLEYAMQERVSLEKVKADLARTAMVEGTRKELAAAELALAREVGMHDRTHEKIMHNEDLGKDMKMTPGNSPSVIRDEVSTSVTP